MAVPRINKLRVINTLNSSTPAASTTIYFVINNLQETKLYVQMLVQPLPEEVDSSMVEILSVSHNGKRGYGPSLKPLFIKARAAKAPTQASPSVAPAHDTLRQRVNPTVPLPRPESIVPGQDCPASSILSGRGVLIVAHQRAKPFRGQPFKPLEIEHFN